MVAAGVGGGRQLLRGISLAAARKVVTRGTHRARQPAEMLAAVRPLLATAGVTRLANITGLDRIGIPVYVGARPNARILSQSAGKGITPELAELSAAMEGIELFHAEFANLPTLDQTYAELAREHHVVEVDQLPLSRYSLFSPINAEQWTLGWDLMQSQEVGVPLDCVVLPVRTAAPSKLFSFQTTSNGVASGCELVEALAVGLLEVIERDSVAASKGAAEWFGRPIPRVDLKTAGAYPLAHELLGKLEDGGVQPLVYDCTVDTRVTVFMTLLYDTRERRVGLAEGSGAHLDPELALVRSLTEAAQSRTVAIAGARDDRCEPDLLRIRLTDSRSRIEELESQSCSVDLREYTTVAAATFREDVDCILERLVEAGFRRALALDLTLPEFSETLSVVRVIIPGMDGPGVERYGPSGRARKLAEGPA
jgi:YcaO-like protein with predicted kinase domain